MNLIKNNIKKIGLIAAILIAVIAVLVAVLTIRNKQLVKQAHTIVANSEVERQMLMAQTTNGAMMYVPLNEAGEAICEMQVHNNSNLILFMQTGATVTLSDGVLVNHQANFYNMMHYIIDYSNNIKKEKGTVICTVKGLNNIKDLMINKWGLTEGQALGSLGNYNAAETSKVLLELILLENESGFNFEINIKVDKDAYHIYQGTTVGKAPELYMPSYLMNFNAFNGLAYNNELAQEYYEQAKAFFYEVATKINPDVVEDNLN